MILLGAGWDGSFTERARRGVQHNNDRVELKESDHVFVA